MENTLKWLRLLHGPEDVIEIRSVSPKPVISGYFKANSPKLASELMKYPNRTFYQSMNPIRSECYSRSQHEHLSERPSETTSDNDILGYQWILVDADPVRASGISASEREKAEAKRVAGKVMHKLKDMGFEWPIVADSGNGYHLLYRIHCALEEKQMIADFLNVLDRWFSTDTVKIDTSVYNPARITKLYGTTARKGADTPERPHRKSGILLVPPGGVKETSWELIRNVAEEVGKEVLSPQPALPAAFRNLSRRDSALRSSLASVEKPNPEISATGGRDWVSPLQGGASGSCFDLPLFLKQHHIEVAKEVKISSGTKYLLKECPFDPEHRDGDAAVFAFSDGRYGFHCFHNGCSGNHWHEFRERVDPKAYSHTPYTLNPAGEPSDNLPALRDDGPRMLDFSEIPTVDRSKIVVIRSRMKGLDDTIGGFNKGELSVWSGGNASGKSTLVSQLGLAAVSEGFKVALFSGEMPASRVREWVLLQAAGPENVHMDDLVGTHYSLNPGVEEKINEALKGKFAVYDNDFGTNWETVITTVWSWVKEHDASVVIVDNLMALDIPAEGPDKYDMQSRIVKRFSAMAKELNVHVHFICHPRKSEAFLRKTDISGTADLTNVADNVFMVHRTNADFMSQYRSVYPREEIGGDVGNVIEIMKNRDLGVTDHLIRLYYDRRCRTMSDIRGLPVRYAWTEKQTPRMIEIPDAEIPEEWKCS